MNSILIYPMFFCLALTSIAESQPSTRGGHTGHTETDRILALEELVQRQQAAIERLEALLTSRQEKKGKAENVNVVSTENFTSPKSLSIEPKNPTDPDNYVKSKYGVKLYGFVKAEGAYDSDEVDNSNLMRLVRKRRSGGGDDDFTMTAKESRLGVAIDGPSIGDWKSGGRIEGDFYGSASEDSASPRMRLAYVDLTYAKNSFRAGQDWETIQIVLPKTVNFGLMSNQGALWGRRAQLRYTREEPVGEGEKVIMKGAFSRTIANDVDGGGKEDGVDSGLPSFEWNIHYSAKGIIEHPLLVGISGHVGRESLDMEERTHKEFTTWSVMGSALLPLTTDLDLAGTIWTGDNMDSFQGGLSQGINKVQLINIGAAGGWGQLRWNVTEELNWNFAYGTDDPRDGDLESGSPSKNTAYSTNLFYKLHPSLTLAGEYMYVKTDYKDEYDPDTHRVQSALYFYF